MTVTDPTAACDRLALVFEHALRLSQKDRRATDDAIHAPVLRFALAQLRMRIRPAFQPGWLTIDPVHVTLFGGTNTGKSTVVNLLLGRPAAGMGVRARHSQHPEAFRLAAIGDRWLDLGATRFQGYRRYHGEHPPRQTDADLQTHGYRPALAVLDLDHLEPALAPAAATGVVWDAPDFSTEQSDTYFGTVLDLLSLGDLIVMTVTDESYADDRANSLLRMVGESGVAALVVANKLPENPTLLDDISRTLGAAGRSAAPVVRLPEVAGHSPLDRLERLLDRTEARGLREAIHHETAVGPALKRRSLTGALSFLERRLDEFLGPLTKEVSASVQWEETVGRLTRELILDVYKRDYLDGVRYGELNRTLVHLMELLEVPVIGPVLDVTGRVVRIPLRLAGKGFKRLLRLQTDVPKRAAEQEVLEGSIPDWFAAVKAEAQLLARTDPRDIWTEMVQTLESDGFRSVVLADFGRAFNAYRDRMGGEVKRRAEDLYARLEEHPKKLTTMRGANLVVSATSVALVIKTAGLDWSDAVLGPVVAGLWQNLLEWGLGRYLETLRTELKQTQLEAVRKLVADHLEQPVAQLFHGAATASDLARAHDDFALIKAEATRIAEGTQG